MNEIEGIVKDLEAQRTGLQAELGKLDAALSALQGAALPSTTGRRMPRTAPGGAGGRSRPPLSAAARKRIALAQQKRWAKFRAAKKQG